MRTHTAASLIICLLVTANAQTLPTAPAPAPTLVLPAANPAAYSPAANPPSVTPTAESTPTAGAPVVSSVGLTIAPNGARVVAPVAQTVAPSVATPTAVLPPARAPYQAPASAPTAPTTPGTVAGVTPTSAVRTPAPAPGTVPAAPGLVAGVTPASAVRPPSPAPGTSSGLVAGVTPTNAVRPPAPAPGTVPTAPGLVAGVTPTSAVRPPAPGAASPTTARPVIAPAGLVPSNASPPVNSVPGTGLLARAPVAGPAIAPSSSGFYNATVRASNATGTLSNDQSKAFAQQLQSTISGQGINTGVQVTGQNAAPQGAASAGRKLSQTSSLFVLDINISFGPCSQAQAEIIRAILNGLNCNLGGVVVIIVVVFQPVTVVVNVNNYPPVSQPTGYPALPATAPVVVQQSSVTNSRSGGDLNSQNVAGGGIVTQQGVGNTQTVNSNSGNTVNNNSGNTVNNNSGNTVNSGNSNNNNTNISNVNSGNTVTNNIVNNNNSNNQVQNIVNNIVNPSVPGTAGTPGAPGAPGAPGTPGTPATTSAPSTPGTTPGSTPTPAAPATPGGASASTANTVPSPPTYITQAAPAGSVPAVPSPPPAPPASCGTTQPQCRIFTRDMLCCQNEGILTPFQGAQVEILCTHPVRFAITCLATSGPVNVSAASVYNNDYGYNYNFRTNINWLGQTNGYLGKVTVDVEPARLNAARPECSLNLQSPCEFQGNIISTMPTVQALDFSVIDFNSFYQNYVGFPPTNAIGQFSYSWKDPTYPGGCLEQPTLTVPGNFFLGAWPTQPGFAYPCNATATYNAVKQTCPTITQQLSTGVKGIAPN